MLLSPGGAQALRHQELFAGTWATELGSVRMERVIVTHPIAGSSRPSPPRQYWAMRSAMMGVKSGGGHQGRGGIQSLALPRTLGREQREPSDGQ